RSRSAAVAEPRGANGEAVTGSGGRLHFGMVAGIKSERWPTSNRNPRPDCLGIRSKERNRGIAPARRPDAARADLDRHELLRRLEGGFGLRDGFAARQAHALRI